MPRSGASRWWPTAIAAFAAVALVGCSAAPAASPSPTPMPKATSVQEFGAAACSALTAMSRAIGNPDTASDSVLSAALDDAIRSGDLAAVDAAAARMQTELASGRQLAAVAAGWAPGAETAGNVDQLIAAFEAMTEAKRAAASQGLKAADQAGQTALMAAGAADAWQALIGGGSMPGEVRASLSGCRFWEAGAPSAAPAPSVLPVPSVAPYPSLPVPSGLPAASAVFPPASPSPTD